MTGCVAGDPADRLPQAAEDDRLGSGEHVAGHVLPGLYLERDEVRRNRSARHSGGHGVFAGVVRHQGHGIGRQDLLDHVEHSVEHHIDLQGRTDRLADTEDGLEVGGARHGPLVEVGVVERECDLTADRRGQVHVPVVERGVRRGDYHVRPVAGVGRDRNHEQRSGAKRVDGRVAVLAVSGAHAPGAMFALGLLDCRRTRDRVEKAVEGAVCRWRQRHGAAVLHHERHRPGLE